MENKDEQLALDLSNDRPSYTELLSGDGNIPYLDINSLQTKSTMLREFMERILNMTSEMFIYENLPDTLPQQFLERYLQVNGQAMITKADDGNLYAFFGTRGGIMDAYYQPKYFIVANPWLNFFKEVEIDVDGVLAWNDGWRQGLLPLIRTFGIQLIENLVSMKSATVNSRVLFMIETQDDKAKESANIFIEQLELGKQAILASSAMLDGITVHPTRDSNALQHLRENYQYLEAKLYSMLGIKSASNMKRQYVSDEENLSSDDSIIPSTGDMLKHRQIAVEKINKMFGTNITVQLNSIWEVHKEEVDEVIQILKDGVEDEEQESSTETVGDGAEAEGTIETENHEAEGEDTSEQDSESEVNESEDNDEQTDGEEDSDEEVTRSLKDEIAEIELDIELIIKGGNEDDEAEDKPTDKSE